MAETCSENKQSSAALIALLSERESVRSQGQVLSRDMEEFRRIPIQPRVELHALTLAFEIHPIIFQ
jgi:hypothetical protein